MRTDIIIDDEIMRDAMEISGIRTKKGVVEQVMREFIARHARKDLSELRGKVRFADDYDYKANRKGE
ncbi:MAG: type II toxin-antitoxin system VapB family antitoxin, partial [Deltaproteobacteria bacterium]|nr:type II toxin-antitoxin system VapB family antitoxin [Deltaproteobacteria bacterium]